MTASHRSSDGRFHNPWPAAAPQGAAGLLRWWLQRVRQPAARRPPGFPVVEPSPARPRAAPDTLTATWYGHASTLLQIGGRNVVTDPMWSARASPVRFAGPRRFVDPPAPLTSLPPVDVVLITHNHYDHFDLPSIRALAALHPDAEWLAPLGLADAVSRNGASRVAELDWWEETVAGSLRVGCVPAQHFSARSPFDRNRSLWCGWTIDAPEHRVYFAGDTGYGPLFSEIGRRRGPFDLAILPVGAYEPRWFMRPVHLNPEDAVRAFGDLRPPSHGAMLPVHWGTFVLTDEPLDEPPLRTAAAWKAAARSPDQLWLLRHGETRAFGTASGRPGGD